MRGGGGQGSTLEHINCRATGYIGMGWGRATGVSRTENEIVLGNVRQERVRLNSDLLLTKWRNRGNTLYAFTSWSTSSGNYRT